MRFGFDKDFFILKYYKKHLQKIEITEMEPSTLFRAPSMFLGEEEAKSHEYSVFF